MDQWTQQSASFTNIIQNHLTHNTQVMNETSKALTSLNEELKNNMKDIHEAHRRERTEHDDILREIKSK